MSYTNGLDKPTDYFNTVLYTGNGASSHAISGVGFQPDWVWLKDRSDVANHFLFDSVRGVTKAINSNQTYAESTQVNALTAFGSDGFTVGSDGDVNGSGDLIASWNWLASNTTASNTDGSITSTVSANTTSGFSIVSYTGTGANATVGHSLNSSPSVIIFKSRTNGATNWFMYNKNIGATHHLVLNENGASSTSSTLFQDTEPTSSVFSIGTNTNTNESGATFISYCFAEKKGFSKFGSYTGNGSTDGTFVYTGFKPAFVMMKRTGGVQDWIILDNKRPEYNETNRALYPNANYDDIGTDKAIDTLSNGFKLRKNHEAINFSENYIYMAFASNPFVTSTGIPTTAR